MRLRRLEIARFRGIKELTWDVGGPFVCLVGPGDSTKTTILDAIELVLSPRWNIAFDDSDFYAMESTQPIVITATVGDLPDRLKSAGRYGLHLRGWSEAGELHDEFEDDDELVLSIQLRVEPSLEQSWTVVNDRQPEPKQISAQDRESLGCTRLGALVDRHFTWGKGSALARLTTDGESLSGLLADSARAARAVLADVGPERLGALFRAASEAKRIGANMGVASHGQYRPHLDAQEAVVGRAGLTLHDGSVPLKRAGLATRRLLAVAMQREGANASGLSLVDELEHGLEPHRIRRLVRVLRGEGANETTHAITTTHSPVVIGELEAKDLRMVRSVGGLTTLGLVPEALQNVVRKTSEALLARRIVVCEGKTELGLCRALDEAWAAKGQSFALRGAALVFGGGSEAASIANALCSLGYPVAFLGDSDRELVPDPAQLAAAGVRVILWSDSLAVEQRIAADLPMRGIAEIIEFAIDEHGDARIRSSVGTKLGRGVVLSGTPNTWSSQVPEQALRKAVGDAAKDGRGWFKRVDLACEVGGIVVRHLETIPTTDLAKKIEALRTWVHDDGRG